MTKYTVKWSRRLGIDRRVLNEWEKKVHEAIDRRVQLLRSKHVNKRRKHVLQIKKHINYLHDFQRQFVLVPADKAANNVIVVCKKYYRKRRNFRCKKISRFMDWVHNFLFSCALIFVVQVGVVNSLWTGPIIFNFRAH